MLGSAHLSDNNEPNHVSESKVCWLLWIFNLQSPDPEPARHHWEYLIPENVAQAEQDVMLIQHYQDHYQTRLHPSKDPTWFNSLS